MIKNILIAGLFLSSGLVFATADKAKTQTASTITAKIESLILAGEVKEAARLAEKNKGAFDEVMAKLISDVDDQVTDRKIGEAKNKITAIDAFLDAYAAVDKAKTLPRDAVKGRMLRIEGIQLNDNKNYGEAEPVLKQALEMSQRAKDPLLEAGVHNNLGYSLRYQNKLAEALEQFSIAVKMAESQKDDLRAGSYNINLGETQLLRDSPGKAVASFKNAVTQNHTADQPAREARALFMQARAMGLMDLKGGSAAILKQCLQLYKQALDLYEKLGEEGNVSLCWFAMADKTATAKKWDLAAAYAENALPHYVEVKDRPMQNACYSLLAEAYKQLGNPAKAAQNLKLANETKE